MVVGTCVCAIVLAVFVPPPQDGARLGLGMVISVTALEYEFRPPQALDLTRGVQFAFFLTRVFEFKQTMNGNEVPLSTVGCLV